jgi:hypothetical protein
VTIAPAIQRLAAVSLAAMLAVSLGWLFASDVGSPAARLDGAIARSNAAIDACASTVHPEKRDGLQAYLAIEDFFRPAYARAAEFLLARIGARVGLDPVATLGIAQISRQTYLSIVEDGGVAAGEGQGWPGSLRDDCTSIAVLQLYADKHGVSCNGGDVQCAVLFACFWHTGRADSCAKRKDDLAYLANLLATRERIISRVGLRSDGPPPVSHPEYAGRAQPPRSAVLRWEQTPPR